ncbi:hypothetical protein IJO12_06880 [bacterium]|nr:hypothetical protein [bacterium]
MGMDGLSMSNTGLMQEKTSAEITSKTEQVVQGNPSNNSKQVQNLETNRAVREKDEEESNKKKQDTEKEEIFEDGMVETNDDESSDETEFDIEDLNNPNKDFYVKLNAKDDIIELYESSTDRLIETISGNELQSLVRKLNTVSGIFVNKKV